MRQGLTTLEVALVLSITGGVLSVATYTYVDYTREERILAAEAEVRQLRGIVETEHIIRGALPKSLAHVERLAAPTDPWGYPYAYVQLAGGRFELFSRGPDRLARTDDDIYAPGLEPVPPP